MIPTLLISVALVAQIPFDAAVRDLTSKDSETRLRAVRMLKDAAYPEAAVPMAALVTDPEDPIQLEAIAAELNIFLAEKIVTRKRVGFIVEVRNRIEAAPAFASGPLAIGARPVPAEVLTAMRAAARDDNPRVALEALYAFGTLGVQPGGAARRELLRASAADVATLTAAADPAMRYAAAVVAARVFEKRPQDGPVDQPLGDALIVLMNDKDRAVKAAAMHALGVVRYERSIEALTDLFGHYGKGDLAAACLDALARIAHASSAPLFAAQLQAKSAPLRALAIEGLARLGDRSKLPDIQAATGLERSDDVRLASAFASAKLADTPIDPISEALTRTRLRPQATQYLIELVPGRPTLLSRQAQDPDARIRADVADILGLADDPAMLPLAETLLQDGDPQVARAAARAVARLKQAGP